MNHEQWREHQRRDMDITDEQLERVLEVARAATVATGGAVGYDGLKTGIMMMSISASELAIVADGAISKRRVMTIEDRIKELLVEHGMWPDEALAVIEMMKADDVNESMAHRWNDDIEGYPPSLLATLWMKAKDTALKYIDANCPEAFYRPMFLSITAGLWLVADGAGTVAVDTKRRDR